MPVMPPIHSLPFNVPQTMPTLGTQSPSMAGPTGSVSIRRGAELQMHSGLSIARLLGRT
jgi:hypothetical protein